MFNAQLRFSMSGKLFYYHANPEKEKRILFLPGIWSPPLAYSAIWKLDDYEIISPNIINPAFMGPFTPKTFQEAKERILFFWDAFVGRENSKETYAIGHSTGGLMALELAGEYDIKKSLGLNPSAGHKISVDEFFKRLANLVLKSSMNHLLDFPLLHIPGFIANTAFGRIFPEFLKSVIERKVNLKNPSLCSVAYSSNDSIIKEKNFENAYKDVVHDFINVGHFGHAWPLFHDQDMEKILTNFLEN